MWEENAASYSPSNGTSFIGDTGLFLQTALGPTLFFFFHFYSDDKNVHNTGRDMFTYVMQGFRCGQTLGVTKDREGILAANSTSRPVYT